MTSQRKIEANRRNAQKSTGPKTQEGKDKVRLNALTHGLTAQTVVLPHEDSQAYDERRKAWTSELCPDGQVGAYLAERAVRISWQLDRADFYERDRLARRAREIPRQHRRSRVRAAENLMSKLLHPPDRQPTEIRAGRVIHHPEPPHPSLLIHRLEATAEGCRLLLDRWNLICAAADQWLEPHDWPGNALTDRAQIVRLLGFREEEADAALLTDRRASVILQAQEIAEELAHDKISAQRTPIDDDLRDFPYSEVARYWFGREPPQGLAKREVRHYHPAATGLTKEQLKAELQAYVHEHCARLEALLAHHEGSDPDNPADGPADCVVFDDTPEGDRLHRYQAHWSRSLLRTLDVLAKLRKASEPEGPEPTASGGADAINPGHLARGGSVAQCAPEENKPNGPSLKTKTAMTCVECGDAGRGMPDTTLARKAPAVEQGRRCPSDSPGANSACRPGTLQQ